jgi:hypothetical protein
MKTYRLELNPGSQTLVEADRVEEGSRKLSFYRENTIFASWARSSVMHYECLPVSLDDIRQALATGCYPYGSDAGDECPEGDSPASTIQGVPV